jgi:hypothetical protein
MVDAISGGDVVKAVGHLMMVAVGVVLPWLTAGSTAGPALTALFSILGGICALVFSLMYRRYLGILGAGARGKTTPERRAYDALRESLAGDNLAARLYADWLKRFLDAVERFLGDAGGEGQRAFGLKESAPLWTARAFDRCLLLALIYPIVTIFLIWAVSGQVGPAEAALGLKRNVPGFSRGFGLVAIGILSFAIWRGWLTTGWKRWVWWIGAYAGASVFVFAAVAGAVAFAFAVAGALFMSVAIVSAFLNALSGAIFSTISLSLPLTFPLPLTTTFQSSFSAAPGLALARSLWLAPRLPLFVACLVAAELLSPLKSWGGRRPFAVFPRPAHTAQRAFRLGLAWPDAGAAAARHVMPWIGLDLLDMARAVAAFDLPTRVA